MRIVVAFVALGLAGCAAESTSLDTLNESAETENIVVEAAPTQAPAWTAAGNACLDAAPSQAPACGAHDPRLAQALEAGIVAEDPALPSLATPVAIDSPCRARLEEVLDSPALPGAPELEAKRTRILGYAKAEPVLFTRAPLFDAEASPAARTYRAMLERSKTPWGLLQKLGGVFSVNPALGRSVLLREGYLYAETPELAFALVDLVRAQYLFDDARIWIQRGEATLYADRAPNGSYVYANGPQLGQRVKLLLFDRIGNGEPPGASVHRDFRSLRQRLGFDRVKVLRITEEAIAAELRYGSLWVPTVLDASGAHVELGCELVTPDVLPQLAAARAVHARRGRVLTALRRAILAGVDEGLPFDEPLTEYGQQDGQLRRFWLRAYREGRSSYEMNGDRYVTFDVRGRPLVPQVCVDFVFDTLERASGTWWRDRGDPAERVVGKLDFNTLTDETLRRVSSFIELASTRTDWFDALEVPESERIPLKYSGSLADYLTENADRFMAGDVVLIRGYAPWDKPWRPKVMHYHSFFVYETDPITGFPSVLVGNPGRPLLQTWQFEAFRTPERSIWYRIRPQLDWLESVVDVDPADEATLAVPPLAAGPS